MLNSLRQLLGVSWCADIGPQPYVRFLTENLFEDVFSVVLYAQILTGRNKLSFESARRLQLVRPEQLLGQGSGTARRKDHGCRCPSIHLVYVYYLRREKWEGCQSKAERKRVNNHIEGVR